MKDSYLSSSRLMNYEKINIFLDQEWKKVIVFMHWEVDKEIIASLIPENLNIGYSLKNKAYIGVIPFRDCKMSVPRWAFPLPFISSFPSLIYDIC